MFITGILAILQITLLPGMLVLRWLRVRAGVLQFLAYAFGLSLLINYVLIFLLAALKLYTRLTLGMLIASELFFLISANRDVLYLPLGEGVEKTWRALTNWLISLRMKVIAEEDRNETLKNITRLIFLLAALALAIGSILWILQVYRLNLGTVFNSWDAILSWNRWAVAWADNQIPPDTGYYPQLLPANWSLTYVAMNNSAVQFFAKSLAPLFLLWIFLLLFDLGLDGKTFGFFLAVTITRLVTKKFTGEFIAEGYSDIPAAFLAFLAVYTLLKIRAGDDTRTHHLALWLGAAFATAAALTKQAGGFVLLLYPLLAFLLVEKPQAPSHEPEYKVQRWRHLWLSFGIGLLLALSWYGYKYIAIARGLDSSNVNWVTQGIFQGMTYTERMQSAFWTLEKYGYLILFLIPALPLLQKRFRWLVLLVVLPYTVVWMLFFSYDTRNLALVFPFLGLTAGLGMEGVIELLVRGFGWLKPARWKLTWLFLLGCTLLIGLSKLFPDDKLIQRQTELQMQIFAPSLNEKLYDYLEQSGEENPRILTNYPVAYLPGLENAQLEYWFTDLASFDELTRRPEVNYILMPFNASEDIQSAVEQRIRSGQYELLFEDEGYLGYRFIHIRGKTP
ncbi:MAG: hypothetical protein WHV66_07380 [Anaerolineales bacterium]